MNAYLFPTNQAWFEFLSVEPHVDEVNFWTPSPWGGQFRVLRRGEPLLFKLKTPYNAIGGGGFFEHYTELPISYAWDTFGRKNGVASYDQLRSTIAKHRRTQPQPWQDFTIGCILLVEPFFWPPELWIPQPEDWRHSIVRGRGYDLTRGIGRHLWEQVVQRLSTADISTGTGAEKLLVVPGGYGDPLATAHRLGQGTFRAVITDLYQRQCAVTRERALPALEAAHIRPFRENPRHDIRNGLLLRSDVHRLFDTGYVTVTPDYRVEASSRMRDDFDDGENYMRLHGTSILLPSNRDFHPDPEVLRWHNENKFRG